MGIYVMSDIHGEYGLFMQMLEKIEFKDDDMLIILGDVIDRGKDSIKILEYIVNKDNIEFILGNHEQMFLDFVEAKDEQDKYFAYHLWMNNGGYTTLDEYDKLSNSKQQELIEYMKKASLFMIVNDYILVHSGINVVGLENLTIDEILTYQSVDDLVWSREDFYENKAIDGYTIIFGHTPTPFLRNQKDKYDFSIWYDEKYKDKIGVDCGATFKKLGGYLGCIRLNDLREFYI